MIITCPECQKKLKINADRYVGKKLSLTCRNCAEVFLCEVPGGRKILIAHGEPEICQSILDVCSDDQDVILACHDADTARKFLEQHEFSVLLLDVALPGAFPFELIEEIHNSEKSIRIVLLPSIYNRAAYKRRPSSLYGADGYLEIHHLPDQLIPLLNGLAPELALKSKPFCLMSQEGDERALPAANLQGQAEELARMLIADIALYHQGQIDLGIQQQDLESRLESQLEEGRRMMRCRIPQAELDKRDYLLIALERFTTAREKELGREKEDCHG